MPQPEPSELFVPAIAIVKKGIATNSGGSPGCDEIRFTYEVTNQSGEGQILTNVAVTDIDLGGLIAGPDSGDLDVIGLLEPGETWIFSATYGITSQDIINGEFGENPANVSATVQGEGIPISDVSHPTDISGQAPTIIDLTQCRKPGIGIIKEEFPQDLDNDLCFESVLYRFTVGNVAHLPLKNIVVTDNLLGGVVPGPVAGSDINDDGILNPGEEWTYQVLYAIELQITGEVKNQATVQGESMEDGQIVMDLSHNEEYELNGDTISPYDEVCTSSFARLQLVKESNPTDLNTDSCFDAINYTFTIQNGGDVDLRNIELVDDRLGLEFTGPFDGDDNNDGILESTEVWTYTTQYLVTQQDVNIGEVSNQATVTGQVKDFDFLIFDNSDDDDFEENDATVEDVSDYCSILNIGLRKEGNLRDLNQDGCFETIEYIFTVENIGLVDLENIQLTDGNLFGDEPIDNLAPEQDENGDDVLSVGENWEYVVLYPINDGDIDAGIKINQAFVTAVERNEGTPVSDSSHPTDLFDDGDTETITVGACVSEPSISLIKSGTLIDLSGDGCPETILYRFEVINTGIGDLENVSLVDMDLFENESFGPLPGQDVEGDDVLSMGETWAFEGLYSITSVDIDAGIVNNEAEVTANEQGTGIQVMDASHPDNITLDGITQTLTDGACPAGPSIGLIKVGMLEDLDNDDCNELIIYRFIVKNTGTEDLEQISIEDQPLFGDQPIDIPLPNEDTNNDGILSIGEEWVFEAPYSIFQADIDVGFIENQATVFAMASDLGIQDDSDDNSFAENDPTLTLTGEACDFGPGIGLVKVGELKDLVGQDDCPDTIQYTFVVTNIGTRDLDRVSIMDEFLSGDISIDGPLPAVDVNSDGILSVGEYWVYVVLYPITQDDINLGEVENQASVIAYEENTDIQVLDISDFESNWDDRPTITPLVDECLIPNNPEPPTPVGDFEIYNGLTPNGDGLNDYFSIKGIENYPKNSLKIYNRWGVLVYEAEEYGIGNNLFGGTSFGRATIASGKELPSGTYYYILTFFEENPGQPNYTGYLYINRE
ncbi:MAG: gliding motility-associated C-terminal domain-containing protein [Bacteroidota bacterium]